MTCGCRRRDEPDGTLFSAGDYAVVTIPTAAATGAVTREVIELGRQWRVFTVLECPELALSSPIYLHLGESDPGIRILHRGQKIRVPDFLTGALTQGRYVYWSGDALDGWPVDVTLFASDTVDLEVDAPGPVAPEIVTGTIAVDGSTSIGAAGAATVSRWAIQFEVAGGFDGAITPEGQVSAGDGTAQALHYIDASDGTIKTAAITANALILVEASGLGDVILTCAGRTTGSITYYARRIRG